MLTVAEIIKQLKDVLPRPRCDFASGEIVLPCEFTVLAADDRDNAEQRFTETGRIDIDMISSGHMLLVLSVHDDKLRVLMLDSGKVGHVNTCDVHAYVPW
jgi:hypothetical protein